MTTIDAQAVHDEEHIPESKKHHTCDTKTFVGILLALLVLTAVTVWVSLFDFGGFNLWIAMFIASIKAILVMGVFMHLIWDTAINRLFFASSFLFLSLLFIFCFSDLLARGDLETKHTRAMPLNAVDTDLFDVSQSAKDFHSRKKASSDKD